MKHPANFDLVIKFDDEGPADEAEARDMAIAILSTSLHRSAGRYGRFVQACLDEGLIQPFEMPLAIAGQLT